MCVNRLYASAQHDTPQSTAARKGLGADLDAVGRDLVLVLRDGNRGQAQPAVLFAHAHALEDAYAISCQKRISRSDMHFRKPAVRKRTRFHRSRPHADGEPRKLAHLEDLETHALEHAGEHQLLELAALVNPTRIETRRHARKHENPQIAAHPERRRTDGLDAVGADGPLDALEHLAGPGAQLEHRKTAQFAGNHKLAHPVIR